MSIIVGDCLKSLKKMDDCSVQSVITSPPYWGLRDYGEDGQVGLEATPEEYVEKMVEIFREVKRVLRDDGTLWLNLGDSYNGSGGPGSQVDTLKKGGYGKIFKKFDNPNRNYSGLKPKDLVGIPWRVAFALQADGWYLRQDIIWSKPNCMPESVKDRCTKSHEYIFLLTKSRHYYYDNEAIKEPVTSAVNGIGSGGPDTRLKGVLTASGTSGGNNGIAEAKKKLVKQLQSGLIPMKNKRSVWTIKPATFKEAHFAVFPEELVEVCLLAGTKPKDVVLDPFGGSGTTAVSALRHDRSAILLELSEEYAKIAEKRLNNFKKDIGLDKEDVDWL